MDADSRRNSPLPEGDRQHARSICCKSNKEWKYCWAFAEKISSTCSLFLRRGGCSRVPVHSFFNSGLLFPIVSLTASSLSCIFTLILEGFPARPLEIVVDSISQDNGPFGEGSATCEVFEEALKK